MILKPTRRGLLTGVAALAAFEALGRDAEAANLHHANPPGDTAILFHPTNHAANIVISPDQLTASFNGATTDNVWGTAWTTPTFTTGKRCLEFLINAMSNNCMVGIATSDAALTTFVGNDGHAVGFDSSGQVFAPNIGFDDIAGAFFTAGNTVMVADDATNGFTYARSSAQAAWIGRASVADDPSTGTGGLDEAASFFSANVARCFAVSLKNIGDSITIHQTFAQAKPTGYSG